MAGPLDDRVLQAGRAGDRALEDRGHGRGDRVRSLNATRNGRSQAASSRDAARFASVAGSSGAVGTRVGIARGPARNRSSGNGAAYAASTSRRQPRLAARCTSGATSRRQARSTTRRNCHHTLGIGSSPVGRPVLAATTRANRSGCSATSRSPIRPPESCPTSVTSRRLSAGRTRTRGLTTRRAARNCGRPARAGLSDRPNPIRSGAIAAAAGGQQRPSPRRSRNDQLGPPCSSSTASLSAVRFYVAIPQARSVDPRRTASEKPNRADGQSDLSGCSQRRTWTWSSSDRAVRASGARRPGRPREHVRTRARRSGGRRRM